MTALLMPALAGALLGGFRSFAVATSGAMGVGVIQAWLTLYGQSPVLEDFPSLPDAVPFLVIIVVLIIRGTSMPARDFREARLPSIGSVRAPSPRSVSAISGAVATMRIAIGSATSAPITRGSSPSAFSQTGMNGIAMPISTKTTV